MINPTDVILPQDLADLVADEIAPGERIAWVGQPIPSRYARRGLGTALFGIPFTAFAFFWIAVASGFKMPDFSHGFRLFPLFGIPFVLVGLGMLSSPFWMYLKATRTVYVITDRRALTVERGLWQGVSVRSFEPERLTDLNRTQYPDGSGNLVFQRDYHVSNRGGGHFTDIGFLAIPDVKEAEDRIRDLVHKFRSQNSPLGRDGSREG